MFQIMCDYCGTVIKGDHFKLIVEKDASRKAESDLCAGCNNRLGGFLESLRTS